MSHSRSPLRTLGHRVRAGYTLIELMVVVVIVGVLAAVAIPAFRGYIMRSRTGEASTFLGVIKLRQAAYRAEFGQYAGFNADVAAIGWVPGDATVMSDGREMAFPATPVAVGPPEAASPFWAIGAFPDGMVRFGYGIVAGTPAQARSGGGGTDLEADPYLLPGTELDFYFIAQATSDLDDDGEAMVMECTSFRRDIWNSDNNNGWD